MFCALCGKESQQRYANPWCDSCQSSFDIKAIVKQNETKHFRNLFKFCTVCRYPYVFWKSVYHHCPSSVDTLTADWAAATALCDLNPQVTKTNSISERHVTYTSPGPATHPNAHPYGYWVWHY